MHRSRGISQRVSRRGEGSEKPIAEDAVPTSSLSHSAHIALDSILDGFDPLELPQGDLS